MGPSHWGCSRRHAWSAFPAPAPAGLPRQSQPLPRLRPSETSVDCSRSWLSSSSSSCSIRMPFGGPSRVAVFAERDRPRQLTALLCAFDLETDALPLGRQRALEAQPVAGDRAGDVARGESSLVGLGSPFL